MIKPFHRSADVEFYFLGKIIRHIEDWSVIARRHNNYRRVIPVFVEYTQEQVLREGDKLNDPSQFYRGGRLIVPQSKLVETFSLLGHSFFRTDERYDTITKETGFNGRIERFRTSEEDGSRIPFDSSTLSEWDRDISALLKKLPDKVLDIIDMKH